MKGNLVNVWREISAYLRYADAKCIFFSGLNLTVLISILRDNSPAETPVWDLINFDHFFSREIFYQIIVLTLFIGFFIPFISSIPSLTKTALRVKIINYIGKSLSRTKKNSHCATSIYFMNISSYDTEDSFLSAYSHAYKIDEIDEQDEDYLRQIWQVSRIASSKFYSANFSIFFVIIGIALKVSFS